MARFGVAALSLVLVTTTAGAQTLGEVGAAMGVHDGLAGAAVQRAPISRGQLRNAGNPSGSTNPVQILSDYGRRVAAGQAAKSTAKGKWVPAGALGCKNGGTGKGWETAGKSTNHGGASAGNAWAKNDKTARVKR